MQRRKHWQGIQLVGRLYSAQQNKNEHDDKDRSKCPRWVITPAGAVRPGGERPDKQQNKNDEKDCAKRHEISLSCMRLRLDVSAMFATATDLRP